MSPPVTTPTILGIESSCDETAAAIVINGTTVKSNIIATQFELHAEFGGVVPEIASRAHIERILPVIQNALTQANISDPKKQIDAIAVGHRPGLIGSLLVGVAAAKALAWVWQKPLIGVDHVLAHLHATTLHEPNQPLPDPIQFPALGLIVSGGHTTLCHMQSPLDIKTIGRTIDDAVGEAYDKAANMLGLGFPGGPQVDQRAKLGNEKNHELPISRLSKTSLDFSYSGLKTALLYKIRGLPTGKGKSRRFEKDHHDLNESEINDLAASFQKAAINALTLKIQRALNQSPEKSRFQSLVVGGGVSANSKLRTDLHTLTAQNNLRLHLPDLHYCVDNAAMIAGYAALKYQNQQFDNLSLSPQPAGTLS